MKNQIHLSGYFKRIAIGDDQVRDLAFLDRSQQVAHAENLGRAAKTSSSPPRGLGTPRVIWLHDLPSREYPAYPDVRQGSAPYSHRA